MLGLNSLLLDEAMSLRDDGPIILRFVKREKRAPFCKKFIAGVVTGRKSLLCSGRNYKKLKNAKKKSRNGVSSNLYKY